MTKQEFLDKWKLHEMFVDTNTDFKMMLLSNIEDMRLCSNNEQELNNRIDSLKRFIIDFYSAQPKNVATHWF